MCLTGAGAVNLFKIVAVSLAAAAAVCAVVAYWDKIAELFGTCLPWNSTKDATAGFVLRVTVRLMASAGVFGERFARPKTVVS